MAHNDFIRALGVWTTGTPVTKAEFEALDAAQRAAINGDDGGTWNPSSLITIGGNGLDIGTSLRIKSTGTFVILSGGQLLIAAGGSGTLIGPVTADDLTMTTTARVKLASRPLVRVQRNPWSFDSLWTYTVCGYIVTTTTGSSIAYKTLDIPDGATLTRVDTYVLGAGGHAALPASMPSTVVQTGSVGGLAASTTTATDLSANVAAYEVVHAISHTGLAISASNGTAQYVLKLTSESGANAVQGMRATMVVCTYTIADMDDGA